ncbi:MAG: Ig-like domain-containing protein [Lachnospiraceae bacterium]|nr:Ig-like domain-containing protein [Lachnospiraceae bacterium]
MKKRILRPFFLMIALLLFSASASAATTLTVGRTTTLTASQPETSYSAYGGVSYTYVWSSSDSSVVSISGSGQSRTIKGESAGTATVSCIVSMSYYSYDSRLGTLQSRYETKSGGGWTITVTAAGGNSSSSSGTASTSSVAASKLSWSSSRAEMALNEQIRFTVTQYPSGANSSVSWMSSDVSVASVDANGVVTAKKRGTTTITASTSNNISVSCKVTVKKKAKKIVLKSTSISLNKGKTKQLKYSLSPSGSTASLTFSSSDSSVASVDSTGTITANKAGTATITVSSSGGLTAKCKVKVKVKAKSVKLETSSLKMGVGGTRTLTATVKPLDTTQKISWSSSNSSVVSVNKNGKLVAKKTGTATITAKISGDVSATCKVTVKKKVTKIKLTKSKLSMNKGDTQKLKYKLSPSGSYGDVTWTSSNSSVATVSSDGTISATGAGTTTIKAKISGKISAKCVVTVSVPATGVSLDSTSLTLSIGETCSLGHTITPGDTTDTAVWSTDTASVVTVDQNGTLHATGLGTAKVTVKVGSYSANCEIKVVSEIPATGLSFGESDPAVIKGHSLTIPVVLEGASNMTDQASDVTWSSSNPGIATVDANGTVYGVSEGVTTITASLRNYTSTRTIVVAKGAWIDLSKGIAWIEGNRAKTGSGSYFAYSSATGLTLVQSDPSKTYNVYFSTSSTDIDSRYIILAGVTIPNKLDTGLETIIIEAMEGTENVFNNSVSTSYSKSAITFTGSGTLTINSTGNAIQAKSVNFAGGDVTVKTSSKSATVINAKSLTVQRGVTVNVIGGAKAYEPASSSNGYVRNIYGTLNYSSN